MNRLFKNDIILSVIIIGFIAVPVYMQITEIEAPLIIIDSLVIGISIFGFIKAIEELSRSGKLKWCWLNRFMKLPNRRRYKIEFVISLVIALIFLITYNEKFGSQTSNSIAFIVFSIVLTSYLSDSDDETSTLSHLLSGIIILLGMSFGMILIIIFPVSKLIEFLFNYYT